LVTYGFFLALLKSYSLRINELLPYSFAIHPAWEGGEADLYCSYSVVHLI
jgi:hypothetical protein